MLASQRISEAIGTHSFYITIYYLMARILWLIPVYQDISNQYAVSWRGSPSGRQQDEQPYLSASRCFR
ncbi:hypothetical protein I7I48_01737 [Histoplasma ohiense]|nr:hypothetical protein I7I48_01737 [Histoplasma ohiense (nom. inval.)]